MVHLGNQQKRGRGTDSAECGQTLHLLLLGKGACRLDDGHLTVDVNLGDQFLDKFVAAEEPTDLSPQIRRHRPTVTGAVLVEMGDPSLAYPLARDHNAVQRTQAFDPSDEPRALIDEGLAFPTEPFGIFFLDRRNANFTRDRAVAAE